MDLFFFYNATLFSYRGFLFLFIEVSRLSRESLQEVIRHIKSIFARHGIQVEVILNNGPLLISKDFKQFSKDYDFIH